MGLFDKKFCDFCGGKIGFLGNRKVEDGNMCTDCAKKISPFMTDRRQTSVAEMKEHLQYREDNRNSLGLLQDAQTFGQDSVKLLVSRSNHVFAVTKADVGNLGAVNPDVINIYDVQDVNVDMKEYKIEEFYRDSQGNRKSFNPRRYKISYDYIVTIHVRNKWFDEMSFKLNQNRVESTNVAVNMKYNTMSAEVKTALSASASAGANPGETAAERERREMLERAQRFTDPNYAAQEMMRARNEALKVATSSNNPVEGLMKIGFSVNHPSVQPGKDFISVSARLYDAGIPLPAMLKVIDTEQVPNNIPMIDEFADCYHQAIALGVNRDAMRSIVQEANFLEPQLKQDHINPFVHIVLQRPEVRNLYRTQAGTASAPVMMMASATNAAWNCPTCGQAGIVGNFCSTCGTRKPQ